MSAPKKPSPSTGEECQSCVCFNFRKAARVITQIYDEAMRPLGFRSTQLTILLTIQELEPLTVTDLAEEILTDRTTLTRNLQPLERKGLLHIALGEDKRERVVLLTEKGHRLLQKSLPLWQKAQQQILKSVGKNRLRKLLKELSAVLEDIRK